MVSFLTNSITQEDLLALCLGQLASLQPKGCVVDSVLEARDPWSPHNRTFLLMYALIRPQNESLLIAVAARGSQV